MPSNDAQRTRIGDQTGGRVGFFLYTDDFYRDHAAMTGALACVSSKQPREEDYGIVAVFEDIVRQSSWDLLEPEMP